MASLFDPIQLGAVAAPNRILMAPLTRMRATVPGDVPNDLMREYYVQRASATRLKVSGVDLFSAGDVIGGSGSEDLVLRDPRRGVYKRLVLKGGRVVGAVLYGDVSDGAWYFELIERRTDVSAMRDRLLFGKVFCEPLAA